MKTIFRKPLVAASLAAAFAGASGSASAAITGDAGEAFLVPLAVWTNVPGNSQLDTIVQLTIPSTVGAKTIPNVYTASHTTPRGQVQTPPLEIPPPNELPFEVFLNPPAGLGPNNGVHWYFIDYRSITRRDGFIPVTPEDRYTYSLRQHLNGDFANWPGYLLIVTEDGSEQLKADFAFFANAYLTADNSTDPTGPGAASPYAQVAWELPTLPMPDGDDATGWSPTNQVVEALDPEIDVRPVHSGIGTWYPGLTASARKVIDLAIADRLAARPAGYVPSTLMVIWNDSNLDSWTNLAAHLFNMDEWGCSVTIHAPNELNLDFWPGSNTARATEATTNPPFSATSTSPGFVQFKDGSLPPVGKTIRTAPCPGSAHPEIFTADGFVRIQLPLESTDADVNTRTAMYAFSLQMWTTLNTSAYLLPRNNWLTGGFQTPWDQRAWPTSVANDRGIFAGSAQAWTTPQ